MVYTYTNLHLSTVLRSKKRSSRTSRHQRIQLLQILSCSSHGVGHTTTRSKFSILTDRPPVGAKLPHILKYVQAYNKLFPSATLLVIRSEASFFWSSDKANKAYLRPAVQALELLGCLPITCDNKTLPPAFKNVHLSPIIDSRSPKVLVHTFSNGGSWQLTTLSAILSEKYSTPAAPQPSLVVLDSCPGNGGVDKTVAAFSSAIRSPILRFLAALGIRGLFLSHDIHVRVVAILHTFRLFVRRVFSRRAPDSPAQYTPPQTIIDQMKDTLSSSTLLPWLTASTPRLYMYSPRDTMIPDTEVEAHADAAEKRGLRVQRERFEESGHVAHARMYPDRYWGAVADMWRSVNDEVKA